MKTVIEHEVKTITPEIAMSILENNDVNRNISRSHVDALASDMRLNHWVLSPDPIIVHSDGRLLNGQHRLTAVIKTGIPQLFEYYKGDEYDPSTFDSHRSRNLLDRIHIDSGVKMRQHVLSCIRYMNLINNPISEELTPKTTMEFYQKYQPSIDFASSYAKQPFSMPTYLAAIASAYYYVPTDVLTAFCDVVSTGNAKTDKDMIPSRIRIEISGKFPSDHRGNYRPNTRAANKNKYFYFQKAVSNYVNSRLVACIKPADHDIYPLPKE